MYSPKFTDLYHQYCAERHTRIKEDQFAALVYTFPAMLVAMADGYIDSMEKRFMKHLPELLTEGFDDEMEPLADGVELNGNYFKEVNFIAKNIDKWEKPFLDTLKEQLHNSLNERNAIFKAMWQTADSSEDISTVEREKITEISDLLEL